MHGLRSRQVRLKSKIANFTTGLAVTFVALSVIPPLFAIGTALYLRDVIKEHRK